MVHLTRRADVARANYWNCDILQADGCLDIYLIIHHSLSMLSILLFRWHKADISMQSLRGRLPISHCLFLILTVTVPDGAVLGSSSIIHCSSHPFILTFWFRFSCQRSASYSPDTTCSSYVELKPPGLTHRPVRLENLDFGEFTRFKQMPMTRFLIVL